MAAGAYVYQSLHHRVGEGLWRFLKCGESELGRNVWRVIELGVSTGYDCKIKLSCFELHAREESKGLRIFFSSNYDAYFLTLFLLLLLLMLLFLL